jgi:CubicO group peptidase (beta-lactamase class C family)
VTFDGSRVPRELLGDRLDRVADELDREGYAGIHAVCYGDEIVYERGIGYAQQAEKIPYAGDTIVAIGSLTKQFTAALVLVAEERGLVSTGDLLSGFVPGVPRDKALITLHHLLTHTSGLASDFADDYDPVATRDWYVETALRSELRHPVGVRYEYSNAGYSLVAAALEMRTDTPYDELLRNFVLEPAGLSDTGGITRVWPDERIAHGYIDGRDWGTAFERPHGDDGPFWNLRGNGGLQSTARDMLKWHIALRGDDVLPAGARTRLQAPLVSERDHYEVEAGVPYFYGYGWSTRITDRGTRVVRHDGGDGINLATLRRYPDEDVAFFLASNQAEHQAPDIEPRVEAAIFAPP